MQCIEKSSSHYDCSLGQYSFHCMWKTNHLRILFKGRFWLSRYAERPEICISIKLSGNAIDIARSLFPPSPTEWKNTSLPWLIFFCNGEEKQWYSWLALWENGDILFSKTDLLKLSQISGLRAKTIKSWKFTENITLILPTDLCIILQVNLSFGLFRKSISEQLILFS